MTFRENLRLEQIYFNNLRTLIDTLKPWRAEEEPGKVRDILESCIQANAAIILLYKNLGEEWNELTALFNKNAKDLADLKDLLEEYHGELNDKIDDVNNYLMSLIRDLETRMDAAEARLDAIEEDLAGLVRNYIVDLVEDGGTYSLSYNGEPVDFETVAGWMEHPHVVWVRGAMDGEMSVLVEREIDTDPETGSIEWGVVGSVNDTIHDNTVTLLPDGSVNVSTKVFDIGDLSTRLSAAEADIDSLADTKQDKLTAGDGITIDEATNTISASGGTDAPTAFYDSTSYYNYVDVPLANGTLTFSPVGTYSPLPKYNFNYHSEYAQVKPTFPMNNVKVTLEVMFQPTNINKLRSLWASGKLYYRVNANINGPSYEQGLYSTANRVAWAEIEGCFERNSNTLVLGPDAAMDMTNLVYSEDTDFTIDLYFDVWGENLDNTMTAADWAQGLHFRFFIEQM